MKARLTLLFACFGLIAPQQSTPQTISSAAPAQAQTSDLGFSYTVPADWQVVSSQPTLPSLKQQAGQNATSDEEKKGIECVQLLLTARHGSPGSVIVEVALPTACFGREMAESDLPGFAAGASEGLKQNFDLAEPVYGAYTLGTHRFRIERVKGTPKGHAEIPYTVEIACSLLKQAAVCWMTMSANDDDLNIFEHGAVSLDGETAVPLVPVVAFDKKPS